MSRRLVIALSTAVVLTGAAGVTYANQLASGIHAVGGFLGFGTTNPQRPIHITSVPRIRVDTPVRNWEFGADNSPDQFFFGDASSGRRLLQIRGTGDVEVANGGLIVGGQLVIDAEGNISGGGSSAYLVQQARRGDCDSVCGNPGNVISECYGWLSPRCSLKYDGQSSEFTCSSNSTCNRFVCLCSL